MALKTVKAKKVRKGDFIPGLDNGYVFEDPQATSKYYAEYVKIGFHTAEGDEAYVECPDNMPITVERD